MCEKTNEILFWWEKKKSENCNYYLKQWQSFNWKTKLWNKNSEIQREKREMKNNYKQLTSKSPPSRNSSGGFKRSASHALRSSFRMPAKNSANTKRINALNLDQLPAHIPPKALRLLQIDFPPCDKIDKLAAMNPKIATIRKRSVWANASLSKSFTRLIS